MALVYRAVPILSGTIQKTIQKHGKFNKEFGNIEGDLYDLGFVSFEQGYYFFESACKYLCTCYPEGPRYEGCKFFFLFPQDAVECTLSSIDRNSYSHNEWQILEYNIPNEILYKYCGYGFYDEIARVEFRIPESVFKNSCTITSIDKNVLMDKLIDSNKTFMETFNCDNVEFTKNFNSGMELAIKAERNIYNSEFITGKKILFKRAEMLCEDENGELDFLSDYSLTCLLQEKGIKCCEDVVSIRKALEKDSNTVHWNREDSLFDLQRDIKNILSKLSLNEQTLNNDKKPKCKTKNY